ncbi:MAG: FprA family A-type flavoprotein [Thermodesulfobacteriota bacterium]
MKALKIKDDIFWVGVLDPALRVFDIIMKAEHGTTYNAYLVKGSDKVALIETVKQGFTDEFISDLKNAIELERIDYIVLNHLEPDHTGALPALLKHAPNAKIVLSKNAVVLLKKFLKVDRECMGVGDGDSIDLGDRTLKFISAPFLHWPDTMFTYLEEESVLFSCDFLGCHYSDEGIFNDLVGEFDYEFRYYFDHIMRPFKGHVIKGLDKIKELDIDIVCPSHGPVLRKNLRKYIGFYREWANLPDKSSDKKRVLIPYVSAYGSTAKMAEEIAGGIRACGIEDVSVCDLLGVEIPEFIGRVEEADVLILGTPTINGDAVKPVWILLSSIATLNLKGKIGAVFGSYGWSGEGPRLIQERLKGLRFKTPFEPLRISHIFTKDDAELCREFGRSIAGVL